MNSLYRYVLAVLAFSLPRPAHASWPQDGSGISLAPESQHSVSITPHAFGGTIIAWADHREPGNTDIYAQRVTDSGSWHWTVNGLLVNASLEGQFEPSVVGDPEGNTIIVWSDERDNNLDIYAQKLDADGNWLWPADGVAICTETTTQSGPLAVSDGEGGAIIVWTDLRNGLDADYFAQRVDTDGTILWATNGVPVVTTADTQTDHRIVASGVGGAIVTWRDYRDADGEVFAQRLAPNGTAMWATNGVQVSTGAKMLGGVSYGVTTDGVDGCFVSWHDQRVSPPSAYMQRILAAGTLGWVPDLRLTTSPVSQSAPPALVPDGSGGAIVAYNAQNTDIDIFAQRVDASGVPQWTANGVAVVDTTNSQTFFTVAPDPAGMVVAWRDYRDPDDDIYAQLVSHSGFRLWGTQGIPVCTAPESQGGLVMAPAAPSGATVAWVDFRANPAQSDVYANGLGLGIVAVESNEPLIGPVTLRTNAPNPFATQTNLRFSLDRTSPVTIDVFDPNGRRVWNTHWSALTAGDHVVPFVADRRGRRALPNGVYLYRVTADGISETGKLTRVR